MAMAPKNPKKIGVKPFRNKIISAPQCKPCGNAANTVKPTNKIPTISATIKILPTTLNKYKLRHFNV